MRVTGTTLVVLGSLLLACAPAPTHIASVYGPADEPASTPPPVTLAPGAKLVRGSLDKEVIRRVIRKNINHVKYCYERELVTSSSPWPSPSRRLTTA